MKSLAEALPEQITRVQDLIALYKSVPNGQFAAALMQRDIDMAHKAMMEGDVAKMLTAYKELEGWGGE